MNTTSFLIPLRLQGKDDPRVRLAEYAFARLGSVQGVDRQACIHDDDGTDPGLFNHPRAINLAAGYARGDVFVIYDADTTFDDPAPLVAAIAATRMDRQWRMPQTYVQLTEATTITKLGVPPQSWTSLDDSDDVEWVGDGICWSGIVIVPREAFVLVRGYDERYEGWGADDVAFGLAMERLWGPHVRYPGAAVHLWHPRGVQEAGLHEHADAGRELTERYTAAAEDTVAMQAIVDEKPALSLKLGGAAR